MPNHFLTIGLCSCDWGRLEDKADALGLDEPEEINFDELEGTNLCRLIDPLPDALQGIVASDPPARYRHKTTGEYWVEDCNGPMKNANEYERVDLTYQEIRDLVDEYGAADWYEWQRERWGTKWGIYGLKVHRPGGDGMPIMIEFQSAWGPPSPPMMRKIDNYLCEKYCLENFKWIGHDPCDGKTIDIEIEVLNAI